MLLLITGEASSGAEGRRRASGAPKPCSRVSEMVGVEVRRGEPFQRDRGRLGESTASPAGTFHSLQQEKKGRERAKGIKR